MSLILEALRKSEAERRRGQAPGLYAELPPVARTQRQSMPMWLWLLIGVAGFALVLWLIHSLRQPPAPVAIPVVTSNDHGDGTAEIAATTMDSRRPAPAAPFSPPIRTPAQAAKPAPDVTAATSPVVAPPAAPAAPDPSVIAAPSLPVATPEPPAPSAPPTTVAIRDDLLQLTDLAAEERKQLPPLKLSMHMWNDAPAQRFVIIDGHRLAEGDRIGDMVLAAITTDGVVLDWNGRRLKLPIR